MPGIDGGMPGIEGGMPDIEGGMPGIDGGIPGKDVMPEGVAAGKPFTVGVMPGIDGIPAGLEYGGMLDIICDGIPTDVIPCWCTLGDMPFTTGAADEAGGITGIDFKDVGIPGAAGNIHGNACNEPPGVADGIPCAFEDMPLTTGDVADVIPPADIVGGMPGIEGPGDIPTGPVGGML